MQSVINFAKKFGWVRYVYTYFKVSSAIAQKECEALEQTKQKFIFEGHSIPCAEVWAAESLSLLDADPVFIIKRAGGCSKCGIY
jgi:hypothetical protein